MANTYVNIASTTLSSSQATITFGSIPSTYTDLVIHYSARNTDTGITYLNLYINTQSATGLFSQTRLTGNGSTVTSDRLSSYDFSLRHSVDSSSNTANTFGIGEIYIPNYTGAYNKPHYSFSVQEDNSISTNAIVNQVAALWRNTATISTLYLTSTGGSFVSGSSFYLYGIKKN